VVFQGFLGARCRTWTVAARPSSLAVELPSAGLARRKQPRRGHWFQRPVRAAAAIRRVAVDALLGANLHFVQRPPHSLFIFTTHNGDAMDPLRARLRRWTLLLGVLQVTVGCLVGLIPPSAVPWFRGLVMSHIEFTANGVLMIALGLLVNDLRLPRATLWVWFVTLQVGSWTNGSAGLVGAIIGYSSSLMPTLNEKFPPPHGTEHPAVTGLLMTSVLILVPLALTLYGLLRSSEPAEMRARIE